MRLVLVLAVLLALVGCGKDKFTTTPQLKIKSVNSTDISGDELLRIRITLTDKEGDFSEYFAIRKTISSCPAGNFTDSSSLFALPVAFIGTGKKEGEIEVELNRFQRGGNVCGMPGGGVKPDTTVFSFWTRDRAGNTSDTARTGTIIIRP